MPSTRRTLPARRLGPPAVAVVALIALAGCGSTPTVSVAQFQSRDDAICASVSKAEQKLPQPAQGDTKALGVEVGKVADLGQSEVDQLKAQGVPAVDKTAFAKILTSEEQEVGRARTLSTQLAANDLTAAEKTVNSVESSSSALDKQFDAVGLKTCGSGSGSSTSSSSSTSSASG